MTTIRPKRVRMTRQRPWRHEHPDAVIVDRRTRWGNPSRSRPRSLAVEWFRAYLYGDPELLAAVKSELAGKNLACWCPLDQPCHADVLLEVANGGR